MLRALAVFRVLALAYATIAYAFTYDEYARPAGGWVVVIAMAAWTGITAYGYRPPIGMRRRLLLADLAVVCALVLAGLQFDSPERVAEGRAPLPVIWLAAPVAAWAIAWGWRAGIIAATAVGLAVALPPERLSPALDGMVLLLIVGAVIGYLAPLARRAADAIARAERVEAASRERERLARRVHDGVLQVLALVKREGSGELARLAGEQESALRNLLLARPYGPASDHVDLRSLLDAARRPWVTIACPATPVHLPEPVAHEVAAALGEALMNVRRHAGDGARAWILLEEEQDSVSVTVRDDGVGFGGDRLAEAAREGRLGMQLSIMGRMRELGGHATIRSVPGEGTEVVLRVPRKVSP